MGVEVWIGTAEAAGGYGGWAYVGLGGAEPRGVAGGDRRTSRARMALTAALEALGELDPGVDVVLCTADRSLAAGPAAEPDEDADLHARLAAAVSSRTGATRFRLRPAADEASRFADAWAAFALDSAKTKGAFSSPIPKPNLKTFLAKRG